MDDIFIDNEEEIDLKDVVSENVSSLVLDRPVDSGVICFHNGTEDLMLLNVEKYAKRGNIDDILTNIDKFCYSRHWMMHVGDQKGFYLKNAIKESKRKSNNKPIICLELGSYCGYSALCIASQLDDGDKLYSIESNQKCIKWTQRLIDFANVNHKVKIIHGSLESLNTLEIIRNLITVDFSSNNKLNFVFIDHDKRRYLTDLILLEQSNLMSSGCTVFADNINMLDNPNLGYLNHVRDPNGNYFSSVNIDTYIEYSVPLNEKDKLHQAIENAKLVNKNLTNLNDSVEISIYK
mmetsp:Transcript_18358/g.16637  ORF Transcript_18358/g.16637 Transcript_18358/m.16637 type:complete len:292 (+) Transcript_18358:2-877(+)